MTVPKIRGFVLTTGKHPQAQFIPWNKTNFVFEKFPNSPLKTNCQDLLWTLISNYYPDREIINVNIYQAPSGSVYLKHKISPRPILFEDVAIKTNLSRAEVAFVFELYDKGVYTPEQAALKSGLSVEKIIELTNYFNQENFYAS